MEWIKRSQQEPPTPKFKNAILVFIKSDDGIKADQTDIAYYRENEKSWFDYYYNKKVEFTHWMPLPKAPKE
jgi:hypothetical protein